MSTKKTIQINPDLFFNSQTTRKNKEKKPKPMKSQLINPNSLKKQLLNRIKEHKNNENIEKKETSSDSKNENINEFTDEFMESIEYLNLLTKKRKEEDRLDRDRREKQNQLNRTLKNNSFNPVYQEIQLDLPEELQIKPVSPNVRISTEIIDQPFKLNYDKNAIVPYGCLKGGNKPTYREYHNQSTRKNYSMPVLDKTSLSQILPLSEREKRLENLKLKIKLQQDALENEKKMTTENYIRVNNTSNQISQPTFLKEELMKNNVYEKEEIVSNDLKKLVEENKYPKKKIIKRTVKKKYTLGKSPTERKVGVLIKDKNTRKKIINAQKELKKEPIHDVKNYLRKHGLLKAGSNAPPNVVRQIYESSILSGDLMNINKETLLHNIMNENESF